MPALVHRRWYDFGIANRSSLKREGEMNFAGKVALVTGSGRGIGRAIATKFAEEGADLVINFFRNREPAEETAAAIKEIGRRALLVKANVGDLDDLGRMFEEVKAEFGGLDILVCNAASGYNRPVMEQRPKGWEWTMNINARSVLFCAQHAAPLMQARGGGHIVNISSPGSTRVLPEYVVVGASKAALEALTRYLAVEFASMGIVVNAVSPGVVETDALRHFDVLSDGSVIPKAVEATPAGRLVTPRDVANVVTFLCQPEAEMIRGQVIIVDGGYTLPVQGVADFND
jgi:enoyl-[acyl-carrier protein] reductase III